MQNDFAARADWCVKSYEDANHSPVVILKTRLDITAKPDMIVKLSAKGTYDPDGDKLKYKWWHYEEADTYNGSVDIRNAEKRDASFIVPADAAREQIIHVICQVTDDGMPELTSYQRIVVTVE